MKSPKHSTSCNGWIATTPQPAGRRATKVKSNNQSASHPTNQIRSIKSDIVAEDHWAGLDNVHHPLGVYSPLHILRGASLLGNRNHRLHTQATPRVRESLVSCGADGGRLVAAVIARCLRRSYAKHIQIARYEIKARYLKPSRHWAPGEETPTTQQTVFCLVPCAVAGISLTWAIFSTTASLSLESVWMAMSE